MEVTKPESTKIQTTLNVEAYKRVKALARVTGKSDSEVVNYITQSWMVDHFVKEYDFWAAKFEIL
ncbi:hypothetical protein PSCSP1f_00006 [Prochlorococcus phage P-SCSP1f]|nr:hypothetical protein PSCSP1a_00003 [Prochlorococcus phage P-SCSP1a]ULF49586.1 hypothetical protein PSCSP1c_00003 [Prochlorococcus phage P-SCSP1c]ULF49622.1 hypothetical protein PSCSP1d_00003 [Prochlorococcus phage P-SCSP1d]ULF49661.1 hypothetical protein PSCSP1f_00006 [Prochlorococcus phage P-SCSP1f]ULF49741.1 hypothetical protein PSCSP1h_00007 [Prochlorococcus phage P-SCSP1h]ULF49819.1 hypothetical protein PSCSP1k_00005 [Prochlorococcus phage P-SCSP1k]ULF49974.1 hypothetical protein PSCSP